MIPSTRCPTTSVKEKWESYRREVLPKDAGPSQVRECRRAFYAGFSAMLHVAASLGGDDVTQEQGIQTLDALLVECEEFLELVMRNRD